MVSVDEKFIHQAKESAKTNPISDSPEIELADSDTPLHTFASLKDFNKMSAAVDLLGRSGKKIKVHKSLAQYLKYGQVLPASDLHFINAKGQIIIADTLYELAGDFYTKRSVKGGPKIRVPISAKANPSKQASPQGSGNAIDCIGQLSYHLGSEPPSLYYALMGTKAENWINWLGQAYARSTTWIKLYPQSSGAQSNCYAKVEAASMITPDLRNFPPDNTAQMRTILGFYDDDNGAWTEDDRTVEVSWKVEVSDARKKKTGYTASGEFYYGGRLRYSQFVDMTS